MPQIITKSETYRIERAFAESPATIDLRGFDETYAVTLIRFLRDLPHQQPLRVRKASDNSDPETADWQGIFEEEYGAYFHLLCPLLTRDDGRRNWYENWVYISKILKNPVFVENCCMMFSLTFDTPEEVMEYIGDQ